MKKKKIRKQIKKAEVWGKLLDAQRIQNEKDAAEEFLYNLENRIYKDIDGAFSLDTKDTYRAEYIKNCVSSEINNAVKRIRKEKDEQ